MSNPELELAFNFVENTGVNIFLTGRAGTGKTTFLHNLRDRSPKRMVVVAPTGVAAINASGVTIHSFFQLPFGFHIPNAVRNNNEFRRFSKVKIKIIRSMELLVIDEISMVRADMLDAIDEVLRRYRDRTRPFGGVQLLMIGDLQQLSPVIKDDEWEVLKEHYPTPYFFDSIALKDSQYRNIELKHIYRQSDRKFIDLLAKVRNGELDNNTLETINQRYIKDFKPNEGDKYITLTSHNNIAKRINDSKLSQIMESEFSYSASVTGDFPETLYPIDYKLTLKKGAQVMFTRNDSPEKRYVNGTLGRVISISKNIIAVKIIENSEVINVEPATWENIKYSLNSDTKEITEVTEGKFIQYPLKTAWAITIHKSQGLTFDKVIIDAANSFSHGQVYVALSRCRTLEGIVLSTPIRHDSVKKDMTVQYFTDEIEQNPLTEHHLLYDKQNYYRAILIELFDFDQTVVNLRYTRRLVDENLTRTYPKLVSKWNEHLERYMAEIDIVSTKFKLQIDRLMQNADYETNYTLSERVSKGCSYFNDKCEAIIAPLLSTLNIDIDNKDVKKIITNAMSRVTENYKVKKATLESCREQFSIKNYLKAKADVLATEDERKKAISKSAKAERPTQNIKKLADDVSIEDITNAQLFKELKSWRSESATKIGKPTYMVTHQSVLIAIAAIMPTTISELGQIKGVGKSFTDKFGIEVLKIVEKHSGQKGLFSK